MWWRVPNRKSSHYTHIARIYTTKYFAENKTPKQQTTHIYRLTNYKYKLVLYTIGVVYNIWAYSAKRQSTRHSLGTHPIKPFHEVFIMFILYTWALPWLPKLSNHIYTYGMSHMGLTHMIPSHCTYIFTNKTIDDEIKCSMGLNGLHMR